MARLQADVEAALNPDEYLGGYADFSHFISSDYSFSIYRKFATLGARNLLYLQAELQLLESQLMGLDKADKRLIGGLENADEKLSVERAARSWEELKDQANRGNERQAGKLRIIYRIRKLIKEYEDALIRRNQVLRLEKPESGPFEAFKTWFRRTPPNLPVLWDTGFWLLKDEEDMVALGEQEEPDMLSSFIYQHLGYRLRKQRKIPKSWGSIFYYPVERVALIISIISILASATLLVGAIVVLHYVRPMGIKLGIIGAFTLVFALVLRLSTNARRVELHAATAAYAAVLVVFVGVSN